MDKQGADKNLSDITLKCGDAVFHGQKCLLSTQSEYFNALFQGNFSDSNASEIDLSSVFDDEQSFQNVIEFFNTGVVDLSNILLLARYASFFQTKSLKELCEAEIKKCVSLQNCIDYNIFAKSADYNSIEKMTTNVIKKRFHDYFIHEDDTLQLCPSDLKGLLGLDFLIYCTSCDILKFVAKWVLSDMTTKRIEVGQHALDCLKAREQIQADRIGRPFEPFVQSYCRQLEAKLNDSQDLNEDISRSFIQTFQYIIELLPKSEDTSSEEEALFTLSKRKKLDLSLFSEAGGKTTNKHFSTGKHNNLETVYDICLYRPSTKLWYHVDSVDTKLRRDNDEVIVPFYTKSLKLDFIPGLLMFSSRISDEILTYSCLEKNWNSLKDPCKRSRTEEMETIGKHVFVWHEKVFVIKVKLNTSTDDDELSKLFGDSDSRRDESTDESEEEEEMDELASISITGVYFEIYEMDALTGSLSLEITTPEETYICERFLSDLREKDGLIRGSVIARGSESIDELLVVCFLINDSDTVSPLPELCVSFVANIKDESVCFFHETICDELNYQPDALFILEETEGFLVAVNTDTQKESCRVIGSYKFHSNALELVEGLCDPPSDDIDNLTKAAGNSSLWYFNEAFRYNNDFQNVKFHKSEDGKYKSTSTEYTPHPFTTLVAAVETKVNAGIFKNMKPSCFLG